MASELDITPVATYRIQLTPTFGFAETIGILDHLVALGVSHVYLSPVAEAVRILYGGSVKSSNVAAIMGKPDVDGALIEQLEIVK